MRKAIGDTLYSFHKSGSHVTKYERAEPGALGLRESWFRDAIFDDPKLVIAPCRASGLLQQDEEWFPWAKEVRVGEAGLIDVLLLSSYGRLGVVETKLSYNPEKRREVVAQVLDYAIHLQDLTVADLPPIPPDGPNQDDVEECLAGGDFLLVIAGDQLDPRALRLAETFFGRHMTSAWNLAMVDLNLYKDTGSSETLLLVPEIRGVVIAERRQVVRVIVEGATPKAKIVVERMPSADVTERKQSLASDAEFLECVSAQCPESRAPMAVLVEHLRTIQSKTTGRFVCRLWSTSANLYWLNGDKEMRIFALNQHGDFQVWLAYVQKAGKDNVAAILRRLAAPDVQIPPNDRNGSLHVNAENVHSLIGLIDRVVAEVGAIPV